jgi:uncharacterized membrane protein
MPFRFRYIALPAFFLLFAVGLTIFFYPRLPGEVAYHFRDAQPDRWTGRGVATAWLLVPQFLLTGLGAAIVMGIIRIGSRFQSTSGKRSERLLLLMGNMVALPQIILAFAMLTVFSYNSYGLYLMPLWLFAVIVMGLGGFVLGALFFTAIQQALARKS